jgi:hypothetical protein
MKKRYTVRPIGKTAWSECDTLEEAKKDQREASRRMNEKIVIIDEETGKEAEADELQ